MAVNGVGDKLQWASKDLVRSAKLNAILKAMGRYRVLGMTLPGIQYVRSSVSSVELAVRRFHGNWLAVFARWGNLSGYPAPDFPPEVTVTGGTTSGSAVLSTSGEWAWVAVDKGDENASVTVHWNTFESQTGIYFQDVIVTECEEKPTAVPRYGPFGW